MALNFPSSPTNGQTYTDSNSTVWEFDGVKWNVVIGSAYSTFIGAKLSLDTNTFLTDTATPLDYDVENFDTGDFFTFSNASRITIQKTGYYRIAGTFYTGTNGTASSYTFVLRKNGSTNLTTQIAAANQSANYDSTILLTAGDYIDILVSESSSTGSLLSGSYVEISRLGYAPNLALNRSDAFSGSRVKINSNYLLGSTISSLNWDATDFDVNADVLGNTYWNASSPSRLTVRVTGYYQLKSFLITSSNGAENSYTVRIRKNGSTNLTSTTVSPNDSLVLDEIYQLNANDYLELQAGETTSVGSILSTSYLEIIRLGI